MTGVSLGLRTSGSYGSLPQQAQQNGGLLQQNLYIPRRPSKTSLNGSREKEKIFSSTFRFFSRRKVGMLILVVFALLAFITGFFTVNKEDYLDSSGLAFDVRFPNKSYVVSTMVPGEHPLLSNVDSMVNQVLVCHESSSWDPTLSDASASANSSGVSTVLTHPCKGFAFPPPPPGNRRLIGPRPCPVCYIPVEQAIASMPRVPTESPILRHLTYISEKNSLKSDEQHGGSEFGGYPSLTHRNDSFDVKESMTVHCGFVKGCRPGFQTGFDIDVDDLKALSQPYEVIVASAVFGNYDVIQQPLNVGETARNNVPFFMFVDEETEAHMKNISFSENHKQVGLWRIIVVHNVPYSDSRRNGKVPKLLLHRLFPNARFSIWIDGKLQLVVDPYQILEKFLWRQNATFAISRHYSRFDVFEEAEANKAARKYDNVSIDYQIEFYKKEGLTPYTEAKLPITSDVPEGCVIIREHNAITNLFSCLWFNEVDRFTARDQLSFSTVRDALVTRLNWSINMFLDCERRNFVIQAYHRDLLEQRARMASVTSNRRPPRPSQNHHPPPPFIVPTKRSPPVRRGKEKRPGTRRRRKTTPKNKDNSFI